MSTNISFCFLIKQITGNILPLNLMESWLKLIFFTIFLFVGVFVVLEFNETSIVTLSTSHPPSDTDQQQRQQIPLLQKELKALNSEIQFLKHNQNNMSCPVGRVVCITICCRSYVDDSKNVQHACHSEIAAKSVAGNRIIKTNSRQKPVVSAGRRICLWKNF